MQNRKPNTKCIICEKPLYRRPSELNKIRYVACMEHRNEAQKLFGQTKAQKEALKLGRVKGTNHRKGFNHSEDTKKKMSESARKLYDENPNFAKERCLKNRGENHYNWKGGKDNINKSIRLMTEYRNWSEEIKKLDNGLCIVCESDENLESHHLVDLAILIDKYKIINRKQARNISELWDVSNGITLCKRCHYEQHGRTYNN